MKGFLRSLNGRIIASVMLIHVIMVPLLFGGVLYMVERNYQSQYLEHIRGDALELSSLDYSMDEQPRLQLLLEDAVLTGRIAYGLIADANGKKVAAYGAVPSVVAFVEDFEFGGNEDAVYNSIVPILDAKGELVGEFRLGYDETPTREQIQLVYRNGALLAFAYVILNIAVMFLLGRRIVSPIVMLDTASKRIAHGHYSEPLKVDTDIAELVSLSDSLEFMRHELVSQSSAMEHQALHDILTGLPNRALFRDRLDQTIQACRKREDRFALLVLDLDRFKEINDTLGHMTGDLLLTQVAQRLRACLDPADTIARLGGDEFALLLYAATEVQVEYTVRALFDALGKPFKVNSHRLYIGGSIGGVLYPQHGDDFETLFRRADMAMYHAKEHGGGYHLFDANLEAKQHRLVTLGADLRLAIKRNELALHYQPKVEIESGRVVGVEALLRWMHPVRGSIPPQEFVCIAERTGFIHELTEWVLATAIEQAGSWIREGKGLSVAVNFSAHNIEDLDLPNRIQRLLVRHQVPADYLNIELTESAIFSDPAQALNILERISAMGITLSIDDFGTGFSSLYQLRRLPVDQIKIDRSFVSNMLEHENDSAIVRATVHLATDLGLGLVAEGVEDVETLEALRQLGCDMAQGYYIAKPMPASEFGHWYENYSGLARVSA